MVCFRAIIRRCFPTATCGFLAEVIRIGWSNVKFSRDAIPQTLIFFAVILSLGCSVLAIVAGFMVLMTGTAHAQAPALGPGMFEPPPADSNDIACGWINWLFNTNAFGCQLGGAGDYLAANGQTVANLQSTAIQTALINTLAFYSDVILVIAAVVLFYHLTAMIVETAHHGVIMGRRANQVWAPIRLVVAVGLLVPIAAGLNSGQFIIIQVAQWGTMVASNAWAIFLDALDDPNNNNQLVPPIAPMTQQEVSNLVLDYACVQAYNSISCPPNNNNGGAQCAGPQIPFNPQAQNQPDGSFKSDFTPVTQGGGDAVGVITPIFAAITSKARVGNGPEAGLATAIRGPGKPAFTQVQQPIQTFAQTSVEPFLEGLYAGTFAQNIPVNNGFQAIIEQLHSALRANLGNVQAWLQQAMDAVRGVAQQQGWVAAGVVQYSCAHSG